MTLAPSAPQPYLRRSLIEARGAKRMGATLRPVSSVPVTERSALGLTRWAGALAVLLGRVNCNMRRAAR